MPRKQLLGSFGLVHIAELDFSSGTSTLAYSNMAVRDSSVRK
jgi:hypothetical protein